MSDDPWKQQQKKLKEKHDLRNLMVSTLKNKEISTDRYLDRMIEIMGDY